MFGRRRKIIVRGEMVHLFAPTRDCSEEFLLMTTSSIDFHQPWVYPATDMRRFRYYLERLETGRAAGYCVARNVDESIVGVINVNDIIRGGFRSASLGYYAAAAYAGKGYMTEGLALVLDQAFTALELHRLECNVQPDNAASLALIQRLGFRKEGFSPAFLQINGIWRDHERWAILADEWLSAHGVTRPEPRHDELA